MATTQENRIIFSIEFTEKGAIRKIDGVTTSVKKFDAALKKATIANKQFNNTLSGREGMTTNAGLAGATLTELGRTISDMPYGIRGVANNLSQLSTLFTTMVAKVDSNVKGFARVGRAVKMLQAQLMGPLGIVLAFQAAIAALDFFYGANGRAKGAVDDLTKALNKQNGLNYALGIYVDVLNDANSTEEQRIIALAKLQKEGYDPAIGSLKEFRAALDQKQKGDLLEQKYSGDIEESIKKRTQAEEKLIEAKEKLAGISERDRKAIIETGAAIQKQKDIIDLESSKINILKTNLRGFLDDIKNDPSVTGNPFLASLFGLKADKSKSDPDKESAVAKIIRSTTENIKKLTAESDKELLEVARDKALQDIKLAEGTETEKKKARMLVLQQFKIEVDALFEEQKKENKERVAEIMEDAAKVYENAVKALHKANEDATKKMQDTVIFNLRNQIKELNQMKQTTGQLFSSMTSVLTSLNDLQQSFHQANIDRINREKDLILQNDSLTQQEKDKRLKEVESREIAAEKRKIKSERDMFTLQQTLAIAKALLDFKFFTQKMNLETMLLAFTAKKALVDVELDATKNVTGTVGTLPKWIQSFGAIAGPIAYGASIVGMIATIIKARNTAKNAIKNLVPSASGGGGSTPSIQAPAFNVVGATQTSQLAQTIAGAEDKPLRAYVVASDVSTAQELERSTIEGASIG